MSDYLTGADLCHMEGHIYPDAKSADPAERRAAERNEPPSKCSRCGEVNFELRALIAAQTTANRKARSQA
jgi:hypothetical protein